MYGKLPNKKDLLQNKLKVSLSLVRDILFRISSECLPRSVNISTRATMLSPKPVKVPMSASLRWAPNTRFPRTSLTYRLPLPVLWATVTVTACFQVTQAIPVGSRAVAL